MVCDVRVSQARHRQQPCGDHQLSRHQRCHLKPRSGKHGVKLPLRNFNDIAESPASRGLFSKCHIRAKAVDPRSYVDPQRNVCSTLARRASKRGIAPIVLSTTFDPLPRLRVGLVLATTAQRSLRVYLGPASAGFSDPLRETASSSAGIPATSTVARPTRSRRSLPARPGSARSPEIRAKL